MTVDLDKEPEKDKEYNYEEDLNWRDDGDEIGDASMKDYLEGYQIEPYAFQQWAKKKNIKTAANEMINMHFYPEFLADYILTLWNGTDSPLQNFFEGFTLRYNNRLKIDVAKELEKLGYKVHPVLTDDRAYYAKKVNNIIRKASKKSVGMKLEIAKKLFRDSEALRLCLGEIADIQEMGVKVSLKRVADLLDYYKNIFPEDYAISLTDNLIKEKEDNELEHYKDFNLTDESLMSIERMLSQQQDSFFETPQGGDDIGYDYISHMRGFDGVTPEQYETPIAHAKKKD
jgi:hypothetical protein